MKEYKDCQFIVCSKKEIENYEKKETIGYVNKHNGEVVLLTETDKINFELYIVFSKVLWELSELRGDIILQVDNIEYVHEEKINERIPLPNYEKYKEKIKNVPKEISDELYLTPRYVRRVVQKYYNKDK